MGNFGGSPEFQRLVRMPEVIFVSLGSNLSPGIVQRQEPIWVQAFIRETAVE